MRLKDGSAVGVEIVGVPVWCRFSAKASQTAGVEFEEMPLSPMLRPDPMLFSFFGLQEVLQHQAGEQLMLSEFLRAKLVSVCRKTVLRNFPRTL